MEAMKLERFLVGIVGVVMALVVGINVALFIKAEFEKVNEAFAKIEAVKVVR